MSLYVFSVVCSISLLSSFHCMRVSVCLFSSGGYLGCFQFLVIMNKVNINTYVRFLCEHIKFALLLGKFLEVGLQSCV